MTKNISFALTVALILFSPSLRAQIDQTSSSPVKALEEKYDELASRYLEKCNAGDSKIESNLLLVEQGAGLQAGVSFPITMQLVSVIRRLQKDMTDDMCERASEYSDLSKLIGTIVENHTPK